MTQNNPTDNRDPLSGIATISLSVKTGLGALHLRLQVQEQEKRFMFSGIDFSRLISGKMIRGFDRDDFDEQSNPIIAKRLGEFVIFEVYGVHSFYCGFEELRSLWSFKSDLVQIRGESPVKRMHIIEQIAINAMRKVRYPDRFPCVAGAGAV